jgi:hypothetical protein
MLFKIKRGATLPVLKAKVHRAEKRAGQRCNEMPEILKKTDIFFEMESEEACKSAPFCVKAELTEENGCDGCPADYFLSVKFSKMMTASPGDYSGHFKAVFRDTGDVIFIPSSKKLKISVL